MGIVVIGASFVDVKGYPLNTYIPKGRNAGRIENVHGGVCRNVVEDIANVELRPTFVSLIDETGLGEDVLRKLKNHKVETKYIKKVPDGLGTWMAIFDNTGDVVASISKRPNVSALIDILEESGDEIFSTADSIVVEIDVDKEIVKRVFNLAKKYNKEVYGIVSNMSIAAERRDFIQQTGCFVCNLEEAGLFFYDDYTNTPANEMVDILAEKIKHANIKRMIITMGGDGAVYADETGDKGFVPAINVQVLDTTGAGDSFCAGVAIGLTYGKSLKDSCKIGARLAASVIATTDNVCPRFLPSEFGLDIK